MLSRIFRILAPAIGGAADIELLADAPGVHRPQPRKLDLDPGDPSLYILQAHADSLVMLSAQVNKKIKKIPDFFQPGIGTARTSAAGRANRFRRLTRFTSIPSSKIPSSQAAISFRPVSLKGN